MLLRSKKSEHITETYRLQIHKTLASHKIQQIKSKIKIIKMSQNKKYKCKTSNIQGHINNFPDIKSKIYTTKSKASK